MARLVRAATDRNPPTSGGGGCQRAATEIRFLKGRLKFEGAAASAPFPSMIAVWGKA